MRRDGHWSVQGLVGCWAFNESGGKTAFDGVSGLNAVTKGTCTIGPSGLSGDGTVGNSHAEAAATKNILSGDSATYVFTATRTGTNAQNAALSYSQNPALGAVWYFRNPDVTDTGRIAAFTSHNANFNTITSSGVVLPLNTPTTIAFISIPGWKSLYINGRLDGGSSSTASGVIRPQTEPIAFLGRYNSTADYAGGIQYFLIYNRALSPAEIASISANPWQVFEPELLWVPVSAALSFNPAWAIGCNQILGVGYV